MIDFIKKLTPNFREIESPQPLPVHHVQAILSSDQRENNDHLYEAETQEDEYQFTTSQGEVITMVNDCQTEFGRQSLKLLQISIQSIKCHDQDDAHLGHILLQLHNMGIANELNESEVVGRELAVSLTLYKQSNKAHADGMDEITKREKQLAQWSQAIQSKMSENCLLNYKLFGNGLDILDGIQASVEQQSHQLQLLRRTVVDSRRLVLKRGLEIQHKLRLLSRMKYTMEKLQILQVTFGSLSQQMTTFASQEGGIGAYSIIPIMRATQANILKYSLSELNLSCMANSVNYFETKIAFIKSTVARGLDACFVEFVDVNYFSHLQSHFYLEKFYGMEAYLQQLWPAIKRAIKATLVRSYDEFERLSGVRCHEAIPREQLLLFLRVLYAQLIDLMINLHACNRFHENYTADEQHWFDEQYIDQSEFLAYLDALRQEYLSLRGRIWTYVQKKVSSVLTGYQQMNALALEEFIEMIGYSCLLIKRGEDYSQSDSALLCRTLEQLVLGYVEHLHQQNMKNVLTYSNNEEYRRLPVANDQKMSFTTRDLQLKQQSVNREIFTLMHSDRSGDTALSPEKKHTDLNELLENESETQQFYLFGYQNPFKLSSEEFQLVREAFHNKQDASYVLAKSDLEMVFTATSLKIYQMMHPYLVLSFYAVTLSHLILTKYLELIKLYVYYSFRVLVNAPTKSQIEESFGSVLKFDESRDLEPYHAQYDQLSEALIARHKYKLLRLFLDAVRKDEVKDLDTFARDRQEFQDITERALAIESTKFLLRFVRSSTALIQCTNMESEMGAFDLVMQGFSQILYLSYMKQHIKIDGITSSISQAKWDIKEVSPQLPSYVDRLIRFICDQKDKLKSLGGGVIPSQGQNDIFQNLVPYCFYQLMEAYGRAKKVSPQGRDQMLSELKLIYQQVSQTNVDNEMPVELYAAGELYLSVHKGTIEEIWLHIQDYKMFFPLRMMVNLLTTSAAFNNLKRQQKKDDTTRLYRMYNEMFLMK